MCVCMLYVCAYLCAYVCIFMCVCVVCVYVCIFYVCMIYVSDDSLVCVINLLIVAECQQRKILCSLAYLQEVLGSNAYSKSKH